MPYLSRVRIALMLALLAVGAALAGPARAYDNDATHPDVCREAEDLFTFPDLQENLQMIVFGAWCEDENDHVYDTSGDWITIPHFWIADEGDDQLNWWGAYGYENAWMKARILMNRARDTYVGGDHVEAYHLLGHVCHLLADQTVPAHAHYDEHSDDAYELWMAGWHTTIGSTSASAMAPVPEISAAVMQQISNAWGGICAGPWDLIGPLYFLMYTANQRADYFASDGDPGNLDDRHGWMDYSGWPASPRTTDDLVDNDDGNNDDDGDLSRIAFRCYSYAITATARLYEVWRDHLDHEPPTTHAHVDGPAPVREGWRPGGVTLTLIPGDNPGGSGVHETEWGNGLVTPFAYTEPVVIDGEGIRLFSWRSMDRFANWEEMQADTFKIDFTAPEVTIVSPDPAALYLSSEPLTLDFAAVDLRSGIHSVVARLDGVPVDCGQVLDLSRSAGSHTLTLTAEDMAGNTTSASVTFTVRIHALVQLRPEMLDLGSGGGTLTAFVGFPAPYDAALIDAESVLLATGGASTSALPSPTKLVAVGTDALPGRSFKFSRDPLCTALAGQTGTVEPVVSGSLTNGLEFQGSGELTIVSDPDKTAGAATALPTKLALWSAADGAGGGTVVSYALPAAGNVRVRIYDVRGRLIAELEDARRSAGVHSMAWDGRDRTGLRAARGLYLVRLEAPSGTVVAKVAIAGG